MVEDVIRYITDTYRPKVEHPWEKYPDYTTFKDVESGKWFALIMRVQRRVLGPKGLKGDRRDFAELRHLQCMDGGEADPNEWIFVMNLKAPEDFVAMTSGMNGIMPAYHMSKKHWITVLLDGSVPMAQVCDCVERSYRIVTDSPTKRIYEAVKRIPRGFVATYADVAEMAGDRKMARAVGNALHKNPDPEHIPCYRVVNAKGELAGAFAFGGEEVQADLLRADGIEVIGNCVDLAKYRIVCVDSIGNGCAGR